MSELIVKIIRAFPGCKMKIIQNKLIASTILCSGLAVPCYAQSGNSAGTLINTVDENGIDLRSLEYRDGNEELSIGAGDFPARLSLSHTLGSNLDITIKVVDAGHHLYTSGTQMVRVTIGGISRQFNGSGSSYVPLDHRGGYVSQSTEGGSIIYTYFSTSGEELKFVVSDTAACGRDSTGSGIENITCVRISKWTAANGVYADFTYNVRAENRGLERETDVARVSNSLGLRIDFTYTRYLASANSTPDFEITSAIASSDELGVCNAQSTCSRTAGFQYAVVPVDPSYIGLQTATVKTSYTNTLGGVTQYSRNTPLNYPVSWESIRKPANPSIDAIKITYGPYVGDGHNTVSVTDAAGYVWTYSRSGSASSGYVTTRTDPFGQSRVYTFDSIGDLLVFRDEMLKETHWAYDAYGNKLSETRSDGGRTIWDRDSYGHIYRTTVTAATAKPAPDIVTSATFDDYSNCVNVKTCEKPISTTDARGNVTNYSYDPTHGGLVSVTGPASAPGFARPQTRFSYGVVSGAYVLTGISSCRMTSSCVVGSDDETRIVFSYGINGLLPTKRVVQSGSGALQSTTSFVYDAFGNAVREDGPLAGASDSVRRIYDRGGSLVGEISGDPDGTGTRRRVAKRYTYDLDGNRTAVATGSVPNAAVDLSNFLSFQSLNATYDANDQKLSEVLVGSGGVRQETQYSYVAGRLDCMVVRMNAASFMALPASACNPAATGADGPDRITKYGYDNASRLIKVTSGYNTAAASNDWHQLYGNNGKIISVTDGNNNTTLYDYDGFSRVQKVTFPGGSFEQYGYDPSGNVTSKQTRDGKYIGLAYDALNRVICADVSNSGCVETFKKYSYDNFGQLTSLSDSTGRVLSFSYDALGRKTAQGDNYYAIGNDSFAYDLAGHRTRLTWGGGDNNYVTYDYRYTGELSAVRNDAGAALVTFAYDDIGRRTGISRANGTQTSFNYDDVSRLSKITQDLGGVAQDLTITFGYNAAGQIIQRQSSNDAYSWNGYAGININRTYNVNALNQVASAGSTSTGYTYYGYDGRGNLTSAGSDSYAYNLENQLTSAKSIVLAYDPLGRLDHGVLDYGGADTVLLYDGANVIAEVNRATGALLRRYVPGASESGIDDALIWYEGANLSDPQWLHDDERGSVIAITNSSGANVAINRYDDYGIPDSGNIGRFQYAGQEWISSVGLYYARARFYSPLLGRFMQPDPIGFRGGVNLYGYVGGDPVNFVDPTGLSPCPAGTPEGTLCANYPSPPSDRGAFWGFGLLGALFDFSGSSVLDGLRRHASINQLWTKVVAQPQSSQTCKGPVATYSRGATATLAALVGVNVGVSGNVSVPLSIDLYNPLRGVQFSFSAQGALMGGLGAFAGYGLTNGGGVGRSHSAAGLSSSYYAYAEGDLGAGPAVGISAQGNRSGLSGGAGLLNEKIGEGAGAYVGAGIGKSYTYAFSPFGC